MDFFQKMLEEQRGTLQVQIDEFLENQQKQFSKKMEKAIHSFFQTLQPGVHQLCEEWFCGLQDKYERKVSDQMQRLREHGTQTEVVNSQTQNGGIRTSSDGQFQVDDKIHTNLSENGNQQTGNIVNQITSDQYVQEEEEDDDDELDQEIVDINQDSDDNEEIVDLFAGNSESDEETSQTESTAIAQQQLSQNSEKVFSGSMRLADDSTVDIIAHTINFNDNGKNGNYNSNNSNSNSSNNNIDQDKSFNPYGNILINGKVAEQEVTQKLQTQLERRWLQFWDKKLVIIQTQTERKENFQVKISEGKFLVYKIKLSGCSAQRMGMAVSKWPDVKSYLDTLNDSLSALNLSSIPEWVVKNKIVENSFIGFLYIDNSSSNSSRKDIQSGNKSLQPGKRHREYESQPRKAIRLKQ